VKTLGIDLASDPKKTGACVVAWGAGEAAVEELWVGADDDELVKAHRRVDITGIDAPFGWPIPFVEFVCRSGNSMAVLWTAGNKRKLRFRLTDFRVHEITRHWPLSVSTDLIGVPALRCAGLLERMGVSDRSGDGRVYETYPASALRVWGLPATGYKGPNKRKERESIWAELERLMPWLRFAEPWMVDFLMDSDDALDAFIAALIARAAKVGLTIRPNEEELPRAQTEGWIHVPIEGSLSGLMAGPTGHCAERE
jgi:predicted nuclease with RNAse H fold